MEYGNVDDPRERELYFDLGTFTYTTAYHFKSSKQWNISAGLNGMSQANTNRGSSALIPEYSLNDLGLFLYTQKNLSQFSISGGLRFDSRSIHSKYLEEGGQIRFEAFQRNFSNLSGTLGFSYTPSKAWVIKWNLARGFRAPSIAELASNGAHEGTNRYEYGQRDLRSETSLQTDIGVEWSTEHLSLSSNFFYNAIQQFIFYRKIPAAAGGDSVIITDENTYMAFAFDQRGARLYGGEFSADLHPHPLDWLHFENSLSWVVGRFAQPIEGDQDLPFLPAARLLSELRGEWKKAPSWLKNAYLKLELDHNFTQNRFFGTYNTETLTPAYTLLHLGLGGDLHIKGGQVVNLYFAVQNIGDVAYQNHLSRLKYTALNPVTGRYGVFNMGRNYTLRFNIPFQSKLRG
jgi:iron complex outermembrane receptor protein